MDENQPLNSFFEDQVMDNLTGIGEREETLLEAIDGLCHSPFGLLPNELIAEIFSHCVPEGVDSDGFPYLPKPLFSQLPLLFGRVCRVWRQVSQSTPSLWSGISISDAYPSYSNIIVALIKDWMTLSGSCPLTISFISGSKSTSSLEYIQFPINAILTELICHSRRWKHTNFCLHSSYMFILTGLPREMPLLKTMKLTTLKNSTASPVTTNLDIAPHISKCIIVGGLVIRFSTQMHHLQVLEMRNRCSIVDLFAILPLCPWLIELSAELQSSSADTQISPDVCHLERLQMIDIRWRRSYHLPEQFRFWNCIYAPTIKHLRFEITRMSPYLHPFTDLLSWMREMQIDLQSLHLIGLHWMDAEATELQEILRISTNLESLTLRSDDKYYDFSHAFRFLTIPTNISFESVLCPYLQVFETTADFLIDDRIFIEMLTSRCYEKVYPDTDKRLQGSERAPQIAALGTVCFISSGTTCFIPLKEKLTSNEDFRGVHFTYKLEEDLLS